MHYLYTYVSLFFFFFLKAPYGYEKKAINNHDIYFESVSI